MAKEPQNTQTEDNQRKIYVLPKELVERISEFQKRNGFSSEVEAVRSLLDKALLSYHTPNDLIEKILNTDRTPLAVEKTVKDLLFNHPLVENINVYKGQYTFTLANGKSYHIDQDGVLYEQDVNSGDLERLSPL